MLIKFIYSSFEKSVHHKVVRPKVRFQGRLRENIFSQNLTIVPQNLIFRLRLLTK